MCRLALKYSQIQSQQFPEGACPQEIAEIEFASIFKNFLGALGVRTM